MCFPLALRKNNYPLPAARVLLFPLIYEGKELVWEDESEVIELRGGAVFHRFSSLYFCPVRYLPVTCPLAFQATRGKAQKRAWAARCLDSHLKPDLTL